MQTAVRATGAVALLLAMVTVPAAGAGRVWFVPWKVLDPGAPAPSSPLVLYWIPGSQEEIRRSGLVHSRALTVYSARCVAMHVVRLDDAARLEELGTPAPPAVILLGETGEIDRITARSGALRTTDVESMVRAALGAGEATCQKELDAAHALARRGESEAASALYERVAQRRCTFPRLAREAERALARIRPR